MHVPHLKLGQTAAEMMIARLSGEPTVHVRDIGFTLIPGSTVRHPHDT
jgi:LacI family gluconate utilization system Gnt-I transcriptional repressor